MEKSQRKIYGIILSGSVIANAVFLAATMGINRNTSRFCSQGMGSCFCICTIIFDIVMFKVYVMYQEQKSDEAYETKKLLIS